MQHNKLKLTCNIFAGICAILMLLYSAYFCYILR